MEGGEARFVCLVRDGEGLVKGSESSSSIVGKWMIMSKLNMLNGKRTWAGCLGGSVG